MNSEGCSLNQWAGWNNVPRWSRDGRFVYFSSNRSGSPQIRTIGVEGGAAAQITGNGGFAAVQSEDGGFLYYSKPQEPGIWRLPLRDGLPSGPESQVMDSLNSHD